MPNNDLIYRAPLVENITKYINTLEELGVDMTFTKVVLSFINSAPAIDTQGEDDVQDQ